MKRDVGGKSYRASDQPAQDYPKNAAEKTHHSRFREKQKANVPVRSTESFKNSNFAAPLQNRHHQSIDNTERGNCQSQAAEYQKKQIEDLKHLAQSFSGVKKRKSSVAHLLDRVFHTFYLRRCFHAHCEAIVCLFGTGTPQKAS